MRTFDEIFDKMSWNTNFNIKQIKALVKNYLDRNYTPQEIGRYAVEEVNRIDEVSLNHIQSCIEQAVRIYQSQFEVTKNATDVLNNIYQRILSIKKNVSNTLFFGLDKVDYNDHELEALNKLNQALNEFEFNLQDKIPACKRNCARCKVNGKRGCKFENNPVRAREWGIDWVNV